jgi:drug/metabolite transporter (DMT)-like permease
MHYARVTHPRNDHGLRSKVLTAVDSYASLLTLLLANFFLLELVDDRRWGSIGSTVLGAVALAVAISDPQTGHRVRQRDGWTIAVAVALSSLLLIETSDRLVGLSYLIPVGLLVTATLPVTLSRVLGHRRVTFETILGAVCIFVLVGLLFAFLFLAIDGLRDAPFFRQAGPHDQGDYLYFSFVVLTTLGFGDLAPTRGLPQAVVVIEALVGQVFLVTLVARLVTVWSRAER